MRPTRRLLLAAALAAPLGAAAPARAWPSHMSMGVVALDLIGHGDSLEFRVRNISGEALRLDSPFAHSVPLVSRVRIRRLPEGVLVTHGINLDEWGSTAQMESVVYTEESIRQVMQPFAAGAMISRVIPFATLVDIIQTQELLTQTLEPLRPERRYGVEFEINPFFLRADGELGLASAIASQTCETLPGPAWEVAVG